ncbi:uncharacterized protein LOC114580528 [Dendrobium catenatum]|uniref:uncharacterized protein LOC114580528 n=1 Tax=Dendrobium catenatum TaxID=906689 RepID=UPI00109FA96D|nr:uncharacterized protein LOC114580528 [Dendrobium catenatum]
MNLNRLKSTLERRILELQNLDCSPAGLSPERVAELRDCISELNDTLARLTTWWRQRAKTRWIEEGDANSHFFHMVATGRRRDNRVNCILTNEGQRVTDAGAIRTVFTEFFREKWRERDASLLDWPDFHEQDKVPEHFLASLTAVVTDREVWEAVHAMGNNRAPGRDGITTSFLKFFWDIIKADMLRAVQDFFISNTMHEEWKETLIILIPKVANADGPTKFRPISLCQSLYKVVAKIIVNRMKPVLSFVVGEEQGAFVPGRSISNHGLLAQEIIGNFQHSTKLSGMMALKVDMEQAYDCMDWATLEHVMRLMEFPEQFINWVMCCISFPKFQLIINGCRSDWIYGRSGFRQGCPLSPYLFILCSELLTKAIAQRGGTIGVQVSRHAPTVSHLLYADDVLVFADASASNARTTIALLRDYCSWTGQRINCAKSAILFSKRCPLWKQRRIARDIDFRRVQSLEYLGIQLVMRKLTKSDFTKVVRSVSDKVNVWGRRHLSLAGRATLIRTSLLATPMYLMTHTAVPAGTLNAIERMARQFLWQKNPSKKGLHYVSWRELCCPLSAGGLGFHASSTWQSPLRARLAWDVLHNDGSLLGRTIAAKYGLDLWNSPVGRSASVTWKIIKDGAMALRPIVRWNIWNGNRVDALHDIWIADRCLARWPSFFAVDAVEGRMVSDFLDDNLQWHRDLIHLSFGPTLAERIFAIPTRTRGGRDSPELINLPLGTTITAQAYKGSFPPAHYQFLWLRKFKLHPREQLFWWRILRGAVPTNEWLCRRELTVNGDCPWDCNQLETLEHLTVKCSMLAEVLRVLGGWGIGIPFFDSWEDMLGGLAHAAENNPSGGRLYCYIVYQIWRARNDKIHARPYGTPTVLAANALAMLPKCYAMPILEQWCTSQPSRLSSSHCWCTPPPGWVKFNVDASVRPNAVAGLGVIARDHAGRLIAAVGTQVEQWDVTRAEILAGLAFQGAIEEWMHNLDGIIIESDCRNAIHWLQTAFNRLSKFHVLTDGPDLSFLLEFKQVIFLYTPRELNRPADFCANLACFGNTIVMAWDIWSIVLDLMGFLRLSLMGNSALIFLKFPLLYQWMQTDWISGAYELSAGCPCRHCGVLLGIRVWPANANRRCPYLLLTRDVLVVCLRRGSSVSLLNLWLSLIDYLLPGRASRILDCVVQSRHPFLARSVPVEAAVDIALLRSLAFRHARGSISLNIWLPNLAYAICALNIWTSSKWLNDGFGADCAGRFRWGVAVSCASSPMWQRPFVLFDLGSGSIIGLGFGRYCFLAKYGTGFWTISGLGGVVFRITVSLHPPERTFWSGELLSVTREHDTRLNFAVARRGLPKSSPYNSGACHLDEGQAQARGSSDGSWHSSTY